MTSHHPRFGSDDHPLWMPSPQEFDQVVNSPEILRELKWAPVIIEDHDVPDLGGSSTKPGLIKIFLDRQVAKKRPTLKKTRLPWEFWRSAVALHEQIERILHGLGMPYDVEGGPSAHGFATALEHRYVKEKLGADPKDYEADLGALIANAEAEDIKDPPLDLACFPYFDQPDVRDLKILKRLAELGVVDAMPKDKFHPMKIGAQQAPDGHWYLPDAKRKGKYLRVVEQKNGRSASPRAPKMNHMRHAKWRDAKRVQSNARRRSA